MRIPKTFILCLAIPLHLFTSIIQSAEPIPLRAGPLSTLLDADNALLRHVKATPNIVWISLEDITPMMGCYGDGYARTPVFDRLAAEGIRYTRAHSIAPVCSVSRSSIITGMYPSSLGTIHHRSNVKAPAFLKMLPNLLREAGYYTSNNAKQDYNMRTGYLRSSPHWTIPFPPPGFGPRASLILSPRVRTQNSSPPLKL